MNRKLWLQICILTLYFNSTKCEVKLWTQSTSLGDPQSWQDGRIPCFGQSIILPEEVMFVPNQFAFGPETILPNNGMLLFQEGGDNSILDRDVYETAESSCNFSSPATFRAQPYFHWYDPGNWQSGAYYASDNSPIPHLHRVPCRFDEAHFPKMSAFKVKVADHPVTISRLLMNGVSIDSSQFRSIYSGGDGYSKKIGQLILQVNESVSVMSDICPNGNEGCVCGRDDSEAKIICSLKGAFCPQEAKCSSALKPQDHCCYDICGGIIHIEKPPKTPTFDMVGLSKSIENLLRPKVPTENPTDTDILFDPGNQLDFLHKRPVHKSDTAAFDIQRISETAYQIVVIDRDGDVLNAQKATEKIYQKLMKDYNNKGENDLYIWTEFSGIGPPSALTKAGNVFGILFVLGIAGALVYLAAISYRKKHHTFNFSDFTEFIRRPESLIPSAPTNSTGFTLFENNSGGGIEMEGENEQGASSATEGISFQALQKRRDSFKEEEEATKSSSFENPLFENTQQMLQEKRQKLEEEEQEKRTLNIYSSDPTTTAKTVDNPLYDVMVDIASEASKDLSDGIMENTTATAEDSIYAEIDEPNIDETEKNDEEAQTEAEQKNDDANVLVNFDPLQEDSRIDTTIESNNANDSPEKETIDEGEHSKVDPTIDLSQVFEENAQKLEDSAKDEAKE